MSSSSLVTGKNLILVVYSSVLILWLALIVFGIRAGAGGATFSLLWQFAVLVGLMAASYSGSWGATKTLGALAMLVGLSGLIEAATNQSGLQQAVSGIVGVASLTLVGVMSYAPSRLFLARRRDAENASEVADEDDDDEHDEQDDEHDDEHDDDDEQEQDEHDEHAVTPQEETAQVDRAPCPDCGAMNDARWRRCDECGVPISQRAR